MTASIAQPSIKRLSNARLAILTGGLIAGALDLLQASILFGRRVPLVIAAGLLGPQALHQGAATYVLGVSLHFFIATTFAAVYYFASRRMHFLVEYPLVCGLIYGAIVEDVMNLIVLPLRRSIPQAHTNCMICFWASSYTWSLSACRFRTASAASRNKIRFTELLPRARTIALALPCPLPDTLIHDCTAPIPFTYRESGFLL